jgi:hypothetical protein
MEDRAEGAAGRWRLLDAGLPGELGGRETPMEGRVPFCVRVIRLLPAAATKTKRGGDGRWELAVGGEAWWCKQDSAVLAGLDGIRVR